MEITNYTDKENFFENVSRRNSKLTGNYVFTDNCSYPPREFCS